MGRLASRRRPHFPRQSGRWRARFPTESSADQKAGPHGDPIRRGTGVANPSPGEFEPSSSPRMNFGTSQLGALCHLKREITIRGNGRSELSNGGLNDAVHDLRFHRAGLRVHSGCTKTSERQRQHCETLHIRLRQLKSAVPVPAHSWGAVYWENPHCIKPARVELRSVAAGELPGLTGRSLEKSVHQRVCQPQRPGRCQSSG